MTQPEYDKRKAALHEYHQKRYQENAERFRAVTRAWYVLNRKRRAAKKKADHLKNYKPLWKITVTDPAGFISDYRFLSEACLEYGLPYKTICVKKYPFQYMGFKFHRIENPK